MKQVIGAEIRVEGKQAEQSVGNFKKALKEANQELIAMTDKFGATSNQAAMAAKKVAGLRDAIGDAAALANAFNPDQKFAAFGGAVQGVVSGFSALQGSMALFGDQSKEVEETLLKVQAAMAFSQGISGVFAAKDAFMNFASVIKQTTIFQWANNAATTAAGTIMKAFGASVNTTSMSFKVLKGAIAATGIGLLLVALSEAVEMFNNYASAAEKAAEAQQELNKKTQEYAEIQLQGEMDFLDREEKLQLARLKARGGNEQEIFEMEQEFRRRRAESLQRSYESLALIDAKAAIEKKNQINAINLEGQLANFEHEGKLRSQREAANKERLSKQKAADDKLLAQQKAYNKAAQDLNDELGFQNALNAATAEQKELLEAERKHQNNLRVLRLANESTYQAEIAHQIALKAIKDKYNPPAATVEEDPEFIKLKELTAGKINLETNLTAAVQDGAVGRAAIRKTDYQDQMAKLSAIGQATQALGAIIGEQTAAGKALGIATALINTYQGASEVLRAESVLPEPFGTIQKVASVAAIIATGIKAVKAITSVKIPGKGGGGGVSTPSVSAPVMPSNTRTSLDQNSINGIGNAASGRAFVLDRDIENNRERAVRLNRAARIN